jgi:hypothetical protein
MQRNWMLAAYALVAIAALFPATATVAKPATGSEKEFWDLWVVVDPKDGPNTKAIPTGSNLIYTFIPSTGTKNFRVQFYDDTACAGGSDSYFAIGNASFTNGQTWYLSGDALRDYVNASLPESGSKGFMRFLAHGLLLRDQTDSLEGSCTVLIPLDSPSNNTSPFQSSDTKGTLDENG